jgi:hypothetical protein
MSAYDHVINGNLIVDRFGAWPSFHDAEVLAVALAGHLPQEPACEMVIHAWLMTDQLNARGYYVLVKRTLTRAEGSV